MTLEVKSTNVFERNEQATTRFVVNQGGSRSSKTISIAQLLIIRAIKATVSSTFSVVRKTMPALKVSAMRDFLGLIQEYGLYHDQNYNKTESTYQLGKVLFEFFGMDEPQKSRGRSRDVLWCNEANELTTEDFFQLNIRTTGQVFMDFNPSDEFHWIYDEILTRPDCTFIKSTVFDNPFCPQSIKDEILLLKESNPNKWKVYGLGERGHKEEVIHTNWDLADSIPESPESTMYGLDFGFNHPCVLVRGDFIGKDVWLSEVIYERGLSTAGLLAKMDELVPAQTSDDIIGDSAQPMTIEDIYSYSRKDGGSFNIYPADKEPGSVFSGIQTVNGYRLHILKSSINLQKEIKGYAYKVDKNGRVLDEPVKFNDDGMNAMRYMIQKHESMASMNWVMSA